MDRNEVKASSPGVSAVQLNDCLEDLLNFVLQSSINGTLDFNLALSADFCSGLLKHDDHHHHNITSPTSNGKFIPVFLS